MKLLVLIHRLPCPPDRGSKIRAAAELRYLASRHEVWCAGFLDADGREARGQARKSLAGWRKLCRAVAAVPLRRPIARARALHGLLTGSTATEGYFASAALERQVLKWGRDIDFDAVLAFSSSMAPLALRVPAGRRVLDLVDLDSRKWTDSAQNAAWPMSWVYATEGRRLARREREWMRAFDANILVNEREAALLSDDETDPNGLAPQVHVIETGLPENPEKVSGSFLRDSAASYTMEPTFCLPEGPRIGFIGAMDYPPNIEGVRWFAQTILPLVRTRQPDAEFWIVGRSPTRAVRELDDGAGVHVTGTVPSLEPYLARLRVSVAPLRLARGVQTKVLVAMAAGVPCVVTPCVAEGIGAKAGREILVAESPERFARAVRTLLTNRERAEAMGEAGRQFVLRRYDPDAGLGRLELLLKGYEPAPAERTIEPVADLCRAC